MQDLAGRTAVVTGAGSGAIITGDERTKLNGIEAGADVTDATNVAAAGAVMDTDFTSDGLMKRSGGAGSYTSVTDNSANWDTAYSERRQWDGGSTNLNAATGRTSLGLGSLAVKSSVNNDDWSETDLAAVSWMRLRSLRGREPERFSSIKRTGLSM